MAASAVPERREVHYAGHVQGVGFRYTACSVARRFRVTGYVQNLPDGRVRLVAEGSADELDRFLAAVGEAMRERISAADVEKQAFRDEFSSFEIRH